MGESKVKSFKEMNSFDLTLTKSDKSCHEETVNDIFQSLILDKLCQNTSVLPLDGKKLSERIIKDLYTCWFFDEG